jgi:hypothetical protein
MTDTIGKIEITEEHDDLTVAYMVGFSKGMDKANKDAAERYAKFMCRQDGKPEIGEDGSPQWWEYLMTARQILGVG